jgi:hypothetical protein
MQVAVGKDRQRNRLYVGPPTKGPTCAKCISAEKNQSDDFSVDSTDDEDQ